MPLDNAFEPMIKNIGNYVSGTLYGPGVIPPIGITNYDGTALASTADTHLLAAKDPVINEIAVGMSGNMIGENTLTGVPPLQRPNSAGYPLRWLNIALSPYQEGSGDPAPDNIRPIHGTNKINVFAEESYDPSATPKAVIIIPTLSANQWDEEWEKGTIDSSTGENKSDNTRIRSKNYTKILPNTTYYFVDPTSDNNAMLYYYTADKQYIRRVGWTMGSFTTPENAYYLRFILGTPYGTTYNHDIAINYPSSVTTYNPYTDTVYGGTLDLATGDGTIDTASVDLGTLTWSYNSSRQYFTAQITDIKTGIPVSNPLDFILCEAYSTASKPGYSNVNDLNIGTGAASSVSTNTIIIMDTQYSDPSIFTSAVTGIKIVYELATPIPFSTDGHSITLPQDDVTLWATSEDGSVGNMTAVYIQNE